MPTPACWKIAIAPAALLVMTACSQNEPDTPVPDPSQSAVPVSVQTAAPDAPVAERTVAAPGTPLPAPSGSATGSEPRSDADDGFGTPTSFTIPAAFQGRWVGQEADCATASETLLLVRPRMVEFYESAGQVRGVKVESEDSITLDLAMQGEGQSWRLLNRFVLKNNNQMLSISDLSRGDGDPFERKKCPA